jgi:hypothetical protein
MVLKFTNINKTNNLLCKFVNGSLVVTNRHVFNSMYVEAAVICITPFVKRFVVSYILNWCCSTFHVCLLRSIFMIPCGLLVHLIDRSMFSVNFSSISAIYRSVGLWVEENLFMFLFAWLLLGDPIIKMLRVGIPLTGFTSPYVCVHQYVMIHIRNYKSFNKRSDAYNSRFNVHTVKYMSICYHERAIDKLISM